MSGFISGLVVMGLIVWVFFTVVELWHREYKRAAVSACVAVFQAALVVGLL